MSKGEEVSNELSSTSNDIASGIQLKNILSSIYCSNSKIGISYYDQTAATVYILEEIQNDMEHELLKLLLFQISPDIIIIPNNTNQELLNILQVENPVGDGGTSSEKSNRREIYLRSSSDFSYHASRNRLISFKIKANGCANGNFNDRTLYSELAAFFDIDENHLSVGCLGALISYISKSGDSLSQPLAIKLHQMKDILFISVQSLRALRIFDPENHPNMHSQRKKEGLSLFGLLDNTITAIGKKLLKSWLTRPLQIIKKLQERQEAVSFFIKPQNSSASDEIRKSLKNIKNIPKIIQTMKIQFGIQDWRRLIMFSFHMLRIRDCLHDMDGFDSLELFQDIIGIEESKKLKELGNLINDVIDFQESSKEDRCVVKQHIDKELDDMKSLYNRLDNILNEVAERVGPGFSTSISDKFRIVYFPQLGYLVSVEINKNILLESQLCEVKANDLEVQFSSADAIYCKNKDMRELDTNLGDIHGLIVEREIEIIQHLKDSIIPFKDILLSCCKYLAKLDCILAFSTAANRHRYSKPELEEKNILIIKDGRNPLRELGPKTFIPNDTYLGDPEIVSEILEFYNLHGEISFQKINIVSGPNFSGKSVYLTQVALIVYMVKAHIGSFVPAEKCIVGIVDKIFTRIQTIETLSVNQSAFMTDCQHVGLSLQYATERSLVILDEFGKGTNMTDGIGLFCGTIEYFRSKNENCPKLIATTHYNGNLRDTNEKVDYYKMDVIQLPEGEEMTFLYKLIQGKCTNSWGIYCAQLAGIPKEVVKRGEELSELLSRYEVIEEKISSEKEISRRNGAKKISNFFRSEFRNWEAKSQTETNESEKELFISTLWEYLAQFEKLF